jgi:U3 small nucleolar RNA-associated protein 23
LLLTAFAKADEAALRPAESELAKLPTSVQQPEPLKKKKKGPKGPNPLSVKKKKPPVPQPVRPELKSDPTHMGSKRKREDEKDGVGTSAETSQVPGGGQKRKRRRKTNADVP